VRSRAWSAVIPLLLLLAIVVLAPKHQVQAGENDASIAPAAPWDDNAAARYLDAREVWWQHWPKSQRDQQTVCVSCHTVLPYALARPLLRKQTGEAAMAAPERIMYAGVVKRVKMWSQVEPFYNDAHSGPNKSIQSRSTESVLNALILASYDARQGHLSEVTRQAFENAWALQVHTGANAGAWTWLNFHNSPWESDISGYWGATLAALAVETAPDSYMKSRGVRQHVKELRSYLRKNYATQPLINQAVLLWVSAKMPGLISKQDRGALLQTLATKQGVDGGWSLADLGTWQRHDHTPLVQKSDGYATGVVVLALDTVGRGKTSTAERGRKWLLQNQDQREGNWFAWSLNKQRDPSADGAQFMNEAATGYAVLALEQAEP
jgi:squalene-hopene/tetraprenyl-beta-curcumene cyclase